MGVVTLGERTCFLALEVSVLGDVALGERTGDLFVFVVGVLFLGLVLAGETLGVLVFLTGDGLATGVLVLVGEGLGVFVFLTGDGLAAGVLAGVFFTGDGVVADLCTALAGGLAAFFCDLVLRGGGRLGGVLTGESCPIFLVGGLPAFFGVVAVVFFAVAATGDLIWAADFDFLAVELLDLPRAN